MITATGQTGTIEFDGQAVVIRRDSLRARGIFGKGEKRIPISSITAVQFKQAGFSQGFIQLTIAGGSEGTAGRRGRVQEAFTDENSVVFLKKASADFELVRDAINAAIAAPSAPAQAAPDLPAQLQQLAVLRDQGILTEDEFQAKKADILGRM